MINARKACIGIKALGAQDVFFYRRRNTSFVIRRGEVL